jgi:hypothetical protein
VEVKAVNLHSMYGFSRIPEDSSRGTTRRYRTRPPLEIYYGAIKSIRKLKMENSVYAEKEDKIFL